MMSCCCLHTSSLWEQMVKAYKYMGEILSVTHTPPDKDPAADCTRKLSSMDIDQLQEQYHCITQKQKLQTHIIVFKTGDNEPMATEGLVTTVAVNKKVQKPKAFEERIPVRGVTLEMLGDGSLHDQTDPWHVHLDIHRLVQVEYQNFQSNVAQDKDKQARFDDERMALMENALVPGTDSVEVCALTANDEHVLSNIRDSRTGEKVGSYRSIQRKPSWKPLTSSTLIHDQMTAVKQMSGSHKLFYYPFPQKKHPGFRKRRDGSAYMSLTEGVELSEASQSVGFRRRNKRGRRHPLCVY
ncbi:LOW QUALITY PROTEIN: uncharacterized protein C9orf152 homolog [Ambystoma mexicanum]|uniref:LOW QUALITY PROTEIN: uncharacterized protein C9orf152 homolog n=1 Tax=Ambystoma mexicanum TaxID=8296 RepID=UPI0037E97FC4